MTTEEAVNWLVQEIRDLLDASDVGLYEFMELLDDPDRPLSAGDKETIAFAVLHRLLDEDRLEMYWTQWPKSENLGSVAIADLPTDPWHPPDDNGRYIALDRI